MLPPTTRTQDATTPPVPPVAALTPETAKIRSTGADNRPEGAAGPPTDHAQARRPQASKSDPADLDGALADEHERALGRGRLIDVLG